MFPQPGQEVAPIQSVSVLSSAVRVPKRRHLGEDLHIWVVSRSQMQRELLQLHSCLSMWEQKKVQSIPYAKDRDDYIIGRGALRRLLGQYLATNPRDIEIQSNAFGKPMLNENELGIEFNTAQSGDYQVLAFCSNRRVGIDLELVDRDVDLMGLMREYFSAFEIQEIGELPYFYQVSAFYKTWTQKEAYIKARGEGYLISSRSFSVDVDPRREMGLLSVKDKSEPFRFYSVELSRDYSCCVAVESSTLSHIRLYRMT